MSMIDGNVSMQPIGGKILPPNKKKPKRKPPVIGGLIVPPGKKPPKKPAVTDIVPSPKPRQLTPEEREKAQKLFLALLDGMSKQDLKMALAEKNASDAYN